MIDKGVCGKRFIWNPSNCECECDKSCNIGEYLDYENCKCRKKLVNKLVQECTEVDEEGKLAKKQKKIAEDENKHKNKCSSCTLYIVLFSIFFTIKVGIGTYLPTYFFYFYWYFKKILLLLSLVSILKQQFHELINGKYEGNKHEKSNILLF